MVLKQNAVSIDVDITCPKHSLTLCCLTFSDRAVVHGCLSAPKGHGDMFCPCTVSVRENSFFSLRTTPMKSHNALQVKKVLDWRWIWTAAHGQPCSFPQESALFRSFPSLWTLICRGVCPLRTGLASASSRQLARSLFVFGVCISSHSLSLLKR